MTLHVFKIKIPCRCRNEFKGEGGGAGSVQAQNYALIIPGHVRV